MFRDALLVASSERESSRSRADTQSRLIRNLGARFPKARSSFTTKRAARPRWCKWPAIAASFRATARHPRTQAAAARLERGPQDPLRRDLHLLRVLQKGGATAQSRRDGRQHRWARLPGEARREATGIVGYRHASLNDAFRSNGLGALAR